MSLWLIGLLVWVLPALLLAPVLIWVFLKNNPSNAPAQDDATAEPVSANEQASERVAAE